MTRWRLSILVFLLVFLSGTAVLILRRDGFGSGVPGRRAPQMRKTEPVKGVLPELKLPGDLRKVRPSGDSWEYTGEAAMNFVTTRGQFTAALLHQGWKPEQRIALDENLSPRELLTFTGGGMELIMMLWKIDTGSTGFAYRREKIIATEIITK